MHSNQILLWLAIYAKKGHTSNDGMFYLTLKKETQTPRERIFT